MIIDATNSKLGRVASHVAKLALIGEKIDIINCEKAVIIGGRESIYKNYKKKSDRGTWKGPFLKRNPEMFFKRAIRGMLPYKRQAGREAFSNIKCHIGIPGEMKDKKATVIKEAVVADTNLSYTTVADICKYLGAKI